MKKKKVIKILWICIIICLLLIGSPIILLFNYMDQTFFGIPAIYAYVFIIWLLLCVLTLVGYKMRWGDRNEKLP